MEKNLNRVTIVAIIASIITIIVSIIGYIVEPDYIFLMLLIVGIVNLLSASIRYTRLDNSRRIIGITTGVLLIVAGIIMIIMIINA